MLIVAVARGYTFNVGIPFTTDDLNAAALPAVTLEGTVGQGELAAGAVTPAATTPGAYFVGVTGGAGNDFTLALDPQPISLESGLWFLIQANRANTGAATLNVNSLGAKALVDCNGQPLTGGELQTGSPQLIQLGADDKFRLMSPPAIPRGLYAEDTGVANACVISLPGLTISDYDVLTGVEIIFKAKVTNTGATTLKINTGTPFSILKAGSTALTAADINAGALISVAWDGSAFQLTSFVQAPALPAVGAEGTHIRPYSITVDAQGRVTAKVLSTYSSTVAVPAMGAAATFTHTLGRLPKVAAWLVAGASPQAGYLAGEEVAIDSIRGGGSNDETKSFSISRSDTIVTIGRAPSPPATQYVLNKGGTSWVAFDDTKWTLKVECE